ncbi:phosphoribosylformylglycinamidine synthase subunit PurS [Raineya orbicola]|jgi:phosphoribosylformylglycinamidine synthase|uniref:Phosphoribosylformylglycinamidine synthase subunit PurS n=1 Tax=Raineya orbicola TaxID=2016530 RepID=A0A2N3IK45_9BACT|nr:phosphoribosylformylglycinamidine synthase subunit PurS [Raineya orbicola]PKQ70686.1 phosphoribosylformylglycinamidine synthase, purS protein [Raineya orbicola]
MKFIAEINIMPLKEILDPQGKAVLLGLKHLQLSEIKDVRVGKHITLSLEASSQQEAKEKVEKACSELLANPIMESYSYTLQEINEKIIRR